MALPLGQGLPGLTNSQPLGGPPLGTTAKTSVVAPYTVVYGANSGNSTSTNQTWTCPKAGTYRFVQWGQGGAGNNAAPGGGGGAQCQTVRKLKAGDTVTINSDSTSATNGIKITLTFPDGTTAISNGGQNSASGGAGGTASGGDINVSGSAGGSFIGGQGASFGNFIGGLGSDAGGGTPRNGVTPGGGGSVSLGGVGAGAALVIIIQEA